MNYWIYPGERRPVVVQAKDKDEAVAKIQKSREYDGFPIYVQTIEEFAALCAVPRHDAK